MAMEPQKGEVVKEIPWDNLYQSEQPVDYDTFSQWFRKHLNPQAPEDALSRRYQDYLEDMKPRWVDTHWVNYAQFRQSTRASAGGAHYTEDKMRAIFLGQDPETNEAKRQTEEKVRAKRNRRRAAIIILILFIPAVLQTALLRGGVMLGGLLSMMISALEICLIGLTIKGKFDKK